MGSGENMLAHGVASQLLAGLSTLKDCVDRCPEAEWNERHNDYPFCQVVFHTLFDCDYHLCGYHEHLQEQVFHHENRASFGDYEELEDFVAERLYHRDFMIRYHEHCQEKVVSVIQAKSDAELLIPESDVRRNMTKLERYVNVIRHTQHHAAQLGFRLQLITGKEMDWIARGYG